MICKVGSIFHNENIVFKNDNSYDINSKYHPCLIISEDEENFYYLTLTSQIPYRSLADKYYKLKRNNDNNLKKESYVNLRYIYKKPICWIEEVGFVNEDILKDLFTYLDMVQEKYKDKDYELIKDKISAVNSVKGKEIK